MSRIPASRHEQLRHWVDHLVHVLPAQAPIRNFVHHNTLHAFQHLPFPQALVAARDTLGASPYLPEETFRAFLAEGRIDDDDLRVAFDDAGLPGLDEVVAAGLDRRAVYLASFKCGVEPITEARLGWLERERRLPDPALWQAACAACGVTTVDEVALKEIADFEWQADAQGWWEELVARVGKGWTLRALLEHLTGEDVLAGVRGVLLQHLGGHLDQGMAAWHNPEREMGLFAAWKASAALDLAWDFDELAHVRGEIAELPNDPLEVLARELDVLVPEADHQLPFLERLLLELPGWSGMVAWRYQHPWEDGRIPVDLADWLAIRVFLERVLCEDLLRRLAGIPLDLGELAEFVAGHPAEFYVRHAVRAFPLPEGLALRAERLLSLGETMPPRAWEETARAIGAWLAHPGRRIRTAWPLFNLVNTLGLGAEALTALAPEARQRLVRVANELDEATRGQVWLLAYERHYRETLFAALAANRGRGEPPPSPVAQLILCMDDREEGTRRHLEEVAPEVETFGAAGFFGMPIYWRGLDDAADTALCPVVVRPSHRITEVPREDALGAAQSHARRRRQRLEWRERFLQGSRSNPLLGPLLVVLGGPLAFLSLAAGLLAPARVGQTLRHWRERLEGRVPTRLAATAEATDAPATPDAPREGFTEAEQAERVAGFLRTIGLVERFAPLVAFLGHGSASRNNPHLAAYDCGACSGRHGGPNARVFAHLANRPEVRRRLADQGIVIPESTWFVAAQHNTCDDGMEWYDTDEVPAARQEAFNRLVAQVAEACRRHAAERCRRFASAPADLAPWPGRRHAAGRLHDPSQARPELGHATNAAAFIGRRAMSRGLFLDRRVFLISYDPTTDDADGHIVESILLAAGPVGAGISLEYYFSTVDNERLGCGSKITHNLTGLFGVMEGAASDLRTGLPRQMIEIHEAMRLLVVVEQSPAVLSAIVARQPALQELVGNAWIVVAAQDPADGRIHRYCPRRGWLPWEGHGSLPRVARSVDWYRGEREALPPALLLGEVA